LFVCLCRKKSTKAVAQAPVTVPPVLVEPAAPEEEPVPVPATVPMVYYSDWFERWIGHVGAWSLTSEPGTSHVAPSYNMHGTAPYYYPPSSAWRGYVSGYSLSRGWGWGRQNARVDPAPGYVLKSYDSVYVAKSYDGVIGPSAPYGVAPAGSYALGDINGQPGRYGNSPFTDWWNRSGRTLAAAYRASPDNPQRSPWPGSPHRSAAGPSRVAYNLKTGENPSGYI